MTHPVSVVVDPSRFPGRARAAYLESFRTRRMDHQFHYESERQAQLWLALHEAYSPARSDANCLDTYAIAFRETALLLGETPVALISIGCGGGQKDAALLHELRQPTTYVGADVSLTLALGSCLRMGNRVKTQPVLLDLARTENLGALVDSLVPTETKRLFAFFGMLPNFEPDEALKPIASAMRPDDLLLVSANLAPGLDYRKGVELVLPQYDNLETRRWLAAVLIDAGLELTPEEIEFSIVERGSGLRIEAGYRFKRRQEIHLDGEQFVFQPGEWFQHFFSYRYLKSALPIHLFLQGIHAKFNWISTSGEEGVFLCDGKIGDVHPETDWSPPVGKEFW